MRIMKNVLGAVAVAGLLTAQPALAASEPVREATPTAETEELAAMGGMWIIAAIIGALVALELTGAIDVIGGDDEPVSP